MSAEELAAAVRRLNGQVAHWTPSRWAASSVSSDSGVSSATGGAARSRGELVHELVQRLADAGADAERRPRRRVPRLADPALPDQLAVVASDLAGAEPEPENLREAATWVAVTRAALRRG